jgi:hypothetical protein
LHQYSVRIADEATMLTGFPTRLAMMGVSREKLKLACTDNG